MQHPFAVKLLDSREESYSVSVDPALVGPLLKQASPINSAIIVVRSVVGLGGSHGAPSVAVIEPGDVVAVQDGNWEDAILVVNHAAKNSGALATTRATGDQAFVHHATEVAPELADLASFTLEQIRSAGVEGVLHEEGGRWVNRPINTFTLKVQPKAGNLHFTLYGNPESYGEGDFLRRDQNSYSRGWVRNKADATKLASLTQRSHARRVGRSRGSEFR